jgi:hypothetical protein
MKTFEHKENKDNWVVTTTQGECFVSELSPLDFYAKEVNDLHNELLYDLLRRKNYLSLGEVYLWVNDSVLGSEATAIINWYKSTYQQIVVHLASVSEYQDPQIFIDTIEILN